MPNLSSEPGGWAQYSILLLSGLLAMTVPIGLQLLSFIFGGGRGKPVKQHELISNELKLNTRFFLAANISMILFVLALVLIPCVVVWSHSPELQGLPSVMGVVLSLLISVLYLVKKGDLGWLRSFFRN